MPIVAESNDGSVITAFEANDSKGLSCPECGESFDHIRSRHIRDGTTVSECFVHNSGSSGGCGESDEHKKMKGIAAAAADNKYESAKVEFEKCIGSKQADVRVEFETGRFPLGKGIGIEVQYKNKSKDIEKTEAEYAENGYSTVWLYPEDFDGYSVQLDSATVATAYSGVIPDTAYQGANRKYLYNIDWSLEVTIPKVPEAIKPKLKMAWARGKEARENRTMRERKRQRRAENGKEKGRAESGSHWQERRYEGWDESSAPDGKVRRFNKQTYQWETLPLEMIPSHIIQRRSPFAGEEPGE